MSYLQIIVNVSIGIGIVFTTGSIALGITAIVSMVAIDAYINYQNKTA